MNSANMGSQMPKIYHEKQILQFCLLHSLNNLFQQENAFTRASLNVIAEKLVLDDPDKQAWTPLSVVFKPHHNALTGNYDINVLIAALKGRGKSVVWHDRRNEASSIDLDGSANNLMGIVINIPVTRYGGLWKSRHWVTLRKIDGVWYNLDSDLKAPYCFKDTEEVGEFLDYIIGVGGEVLLVQNDEEIIDNHNPLCFSHFELPVIALSSIYVSRSSHFGPSSLNCCITLCLFCRSISVTSCCLLKMSTRESNKVSSRPAVNKEIISQKQKSTCTVVENKRQATGSFATRRSNREGCCCIPGISKEALIYKRNCVSKVAGNKRWAAGSCGIRLPKRSELSLVRFLEHLGSKIAKGLCFSSLRKRRSPAAVSSSGRSKQSVIPVDSHRTEAIEDCIEFINSSSSLPRSNSVSANAS
ncbi:josephin-like protein [Mangifera indica]|uniref:josephin-like protein n=1 Tax=Mangifera indica TaxID=29780 RepID=UPI001CF9595D|nr:josephin-like protein [Mangifera indica]